MKRRLVLATSMLFVLFCAFLADFVVRSQPTGDASALPAIAVVFTGQYDRIDRGLDLIASSEVKRLFISGVNPKAGLIKDDFGEQFDLTAEQLNSLEQGHIILAVEARSTLENALETACWLDDQSEVEAVALITSRRHLARASLALERAIAPVRVIRVASDAGRGPFGFRTALRAGAKFAATWIITALPTTFWPVTEPQNCHPH